MSQNSQLQNGRFIIKPQIILSLKLNTQSLNDVNK